MPGVAHIAVTFNVQFEVVASSSAAMAVTRSSWAIKEVTEKSVSWLGKEPVVPPVRS